jgi:hypothetical protein
MPSSECIVDISTNVNGITIKGQIVVQTEWYPVGTEWLLKRKHAEILANHIESAVKEVIEMY